MEDKYILTSDNNEKYLVISRTVYNGITYCWIGKLDDSSEYFFGKIQFIFKYFSPHYRTPSN